MALTPALRAFGQQACDLEHDFACDDRPALVTALLAAAAPAEDWWQAPVSRRIAALLDLALHSSGLHSLDLTLHCEQPGCGKRFDIELPEAAWAQDDGALSGALTPVAVTTETGQPLMTLRRPTGADLRACREDAMTTLLDASPAAVAHALLQRLCLAGTPGDGDAPRAAQALAEADPLVAFSVHCTCPECGTPDDYAIDLEAEALRQLALRQIALVDEVHRIASRYGWSEREIFEVPPARRRLYLQAMNASEEPFA